jgi:hypothetical protein
MTGPVLKVVVVAAGTLSDPFCTVPLVKVAVAPPAVSVKPPRSSVPLVRVIFVMPEVAFKMQVLLPVTIVTLSTLPGIPLGVQLPAVFQAVEIDPFQV